MIPLKFSRERAERKEEPPFGAVSRGDVAENATSVAARVPALQSRCKSKKGRDRSSTLTS